MRGKEVLSHYLAYRIFQIPGAQQLSGQPIDGILFVRIIFTIYQMASGDNTMKSGSEFVFHGLQYGNAGHFFYP